MVRTSAAEDDLTGGLVTRELHLSYTILPPSENEIRELQWVRKGGRPKAVGMHYTAEADGYRKDFREYMRTHYMVEIQKFRKTHKPWHAYRVWIQFYFPAEEILNKGWLNSVKTRAKTPYKKMDVGNRRKLLEDCIAAAIDIDDSLSFDLEMTKFVSTEPLIEIFIAEEDPSFFGIPTDYLRG